MIVIVKQNIAGSWDVWTNDGIEQKRHEYYKNIDTKNEAERLAQIVRDERDKELAKQSQAFEMRKPRTRATYNYRENKKRIEMVLSEETAMLFDTAKTLSGLTHEKFMRQMLNVWLDYGQQIKTDNF